MCACGTYITKLEKKKSLRAYFFSKGIKQESIELCFGQEDVVYIANLIFRSICMTIFVIFPVYDETGHFEYLHEYFRI